MSASAERTIEAAVRAQTKRLLGERLRIALWLCLVTTPIFAIGERFTRLLPVAAGDAIFLAQMAFFIALLRSLRVPALAARVGLLTLVFALELSTITAVSGVLRADASAAPVMLLILTMGAAIFLPWPTGAQILTALTCTAGATANVAMVAGLTTATVPMLIAVAIGAGTSVFIADQVRRSQLALLRENLQRRAMEEALRAARDELEQRVAERTAALSAANRRLEMEVAERRQIEAKLHDAKEAAETASQAKTQFLANMSHELRTPMNAVLGMTGILLDTDLTAEQRECADTVRRAAASMLGLINDLLDISRIETQRLLLEVVDFEVAACVAEAEDLFAEPAAAKGLRLSTTIDPALPRTLRGDPGRIRQILANFLANAVKFTEHGVVVLRAILQERAAERVVVRFEVSDTGIGIAPELQRELFEPFVRADMSTTSRHGGTGLGLAICRRLAEMMQGTVGVDSRPQQGSTFWFTVPLPVASGVEARTAFVCAPRRPLATRARVLVAEDNPMNQLVTVRMLERLGLQADVAGNGLEALEAVARASYAAVLMDCRMPELDGYEATRRIRAHEGTLGRHTPIIAVTANAMNGDRERCLEAGMDDYLPKPVTLAQLDAALHRWIPRLPHAPQAA
jgi:signal transduction histidine kinase/ActR/RegA family two-component response regulator